MDYSIIQEMFQQIREQHDDEWWDYVLNSEKDSPKTNWVSEESEFNLDNPKQIQLTEASDDIF